MADNQLQKQGDSVAAFIRNPTIMQRTEAMLKEGAGEFTAGLLSAVNSNPTLAKCSPVTVYNAALTAAALKLPINSNLGFAYIVPYQNSKKSVDENGRDKWEKVWEAQFQMGYRGFIQLAQRSGQYKRIVAVPVYEGQLVEEDPLMGNTYDWKAKKPDAKVIGYLSRFELINGFVNDLYMTAEEVEAHGAKFSQSYNADKKYKSSKSLWSTDFETMALKTVLKRNLSKFGPMSVDMQKATIHDQAVIREEGKPEYVDGEIVTPEEKEAVARARIQAAEAKRKEADNADHTPAAVQTEDKPEAEDSKKV